MTLQECYESFGGDYADVLARLGSQRMVQKFILKFLDDGNFELLCRSLEAGATEDAFRAAHTIKGMCLNLSFTPLTQSSSLLTEALRAGDLAGALALYNRVREDYAGIVHAIRAFQSELPG